MNTAIAIPMLTSQNALDVTVTPIASVHELLLVKISDRYGITTSWLIAAGRADLVERTVWVHRRFSWGTTGRN